jgi:NAD(P)-dependent dehydrogenase (short-subunit alcohol dehydrogenase family)
MFPVRGAQHAYVRGVGVEVAPYNMQVNATGQTFVENPTYFPPNYLSSPELAERLKAVPVGRLATGREAATFLLFLADPRAASSPGKSFLMQGAGLFDWLGSPPRRRQGLFRPSVRLVNTPPPERRWLQVTA